MADNNDLSLKDLFGRSKETGDAKIQDDIINHIFASCAGENNAAVDANKLISFITPFLLDNSSAVNQLRKTLDPNNLNQEINFDQFHILMEAWISEITEMEDDIHNITPRDSHHLVDLSYTQSTPKSTFGHHLLKEYVESGIMNASISPSKYSLNEFSSTNKGAEKTILEEQIQELEFQKRKMSEEMERMKTELANSLETNENLQDRLEKALRKINEEQKLVDQLQQLTKNKEDDNEIELEKLKKHSDGLEKKVLSLEIKIGNLNEELLEVQNENEKLEKKNQKLLKEKDDVFDEMIRFQTEIDSWKQNFASQQELYAILIEEKKNLQDVNEEYTCEIEKLKFEKNTLENLLKPITKKSLETNLNVSATFTRSNSFSEYSPIAKQILKKHVYNTPKTMFKLKNPITPLHSTEKSQDYNPNSISTSTPEENITKSSLDSNVPTLNNTNTVLVPLKNEDFDSSSPPVMYVIERSDDKSSKDGNKNRSTEDFSKDSDSGDDLPAKLHYIAAIRNTNESLQEEMSKATSEDCCYNSDNFIAEKSFETEEKHCSIQTEIEELKIEEYSCIENKYQIVLDEIEDLKKNNDDLHVEIKNLRDQINVYESLKENQNEKLQEILVDKNKILNEAEKLTENLEKIKNELKIIKNEKNLLQNEHEKLQENFENLQKSRQKLSELYERNKKELDVVKITHEICKQNNKQMSLENSKIGICQEKLAQSLQENERISIEKIELKNKIECLKKNLDFNELKLNEIKTKNVNFLKQLEQCKETITLYKESNDKLNKTNEDLKKLLDDKDKLIKEIKKEIISLKETNESIKKEEEKLNEIIKEFDVELKRKESKISFIENELISLKETKKNINEELILCKETCKNYKNKIETMEILIGNLKENVESKDFLLREQELKLDELQEEIDRKFNELKELTEKFEQLKKENEKSTDKIDELQKDVEKKINENKNIQALLNNHKEILEKIKNTSKENEELREENKKSSDEDKSKIIDEINKSFSETMQKVYKTEADFTLYCKTEIEKYKKENETLKKSYENEIMIIMKEKDSILDRLKHVEREMEENKIEMEMTKSELDMVLSEKDSRPSHNSRELKKKLSTKRFTNYDKLIIKNEKLEYKVSDLEDQLSAERKNLTESISKSKLIEEQLKNLNNENLNLEQQLRTIRIESGNNYFKNVNIDEIMIEIETYKENLYQKRINLEKNTLTSAIYFSIPNDLVRKILKNETCCSKISESFAKFEKEILSVIEQMEISSNVLNYLCLKKTKKINFQNGSSQTEVDVEIKNDKNEVSERKGSFVLKPASFVPKRLDPLESLQFASSGDAGRSRDLGVVFSRPQENEDYYGLQNDSREENVLPTLNEELLQNLGLTNTTLSFQDIPNNDLKEIFKKISSAYDLDQLSITTRLEKQEENTAMKKRKFLEELTIICKQSFPIEDEFRNVEELENVTERLYLTEGSFEDLVISAELLGCLKKEKTMMGCLGVMMEYLKRSRKALKDTESQIRSIESYWTKNNQRRQLPLVPHLNLQSISNQCVCLEKSRVIETHISPRPRSRMIKIITYSLVGWIAFMGIFCLFMVLLLLNEDSTYLPWGFNSFDNPWIPFVKKHYLRGPPPT